MGVRTWLMLVALLGASQAWAVNKCTGKDGKVSFQDAPCTNAAQAARINPSSAKPPDEPVVVEPLGLSGPPQQRYEVAVVAFERLNALAGDCASRFKNDRLERLADFIPCGTYLRHKQAWWNPALAAVEALNKDPAWVAANRPQVARATSAIQRATTNDAFIASRIGP